MRIKVDRFQGMVPQAAVRRLGDFQGRTVQNARIASGDLTPIKSPLPVLASTIKGTVKSIFPLGNNWLVWNTDVDIVKSPIANDSHDRYFYTGDGVPRETNTTLAIGAGPIYPSASYRLGLPPPEAKMTVTPDASGVGLNVERVYLHSFKTVWGEEGPPSAPSTAVTGKVDDVWSLSVLEAAPTNTVAISNVTVSASVATITHAANVHCANNEKWTFSGVRSVEDGESVQVISGSTIDLGVSTPIIDGKKGTIAFAFNRQGGYGLGRYILAKSSTSFTNFHIAFTGSNQLWISGNGGATMDMRSSTTYATSGWHYVVASWDLGALTGKIFIDQADVTGATTFVNAALDLDGPTKSWHLFSNGTLSSFVGYVSGLYANFTTYFDLTVAANLEKFTNSSPVTLLVDQGPTGNLATGAQPELYFNGGWSEFGSNKGSVTLGTTISTDVTDGGVTVTKSDTLVNALNGNSFPVTRVSPTVFTIPLAAFTYISGGTSTRDAPINISTMTRKIYRTTVGGTYQFVAEQAAGLGTYADSVLDTALGELLPDNDLISPPMDMAGLKALPNGYLVGFSGNEVVFSEPNKLHAFPQEYRHSVDYEIVGIGIWGSTAVILTTGSHYVALGSSPANTTLDTLDYNQAIASKRSIAGLEYGVTFVTHNGIGFKGSGEVRNITEQLAEKPQWDQFNAPSMLGGIFDDKYIIFYDSAGDDSKQSGGIIIDLLEPGAEWVNLTLYATALYYDRENGFLYVAVDNTIKKFDAHDAQMQTSFLSKVFQTPQKVCFTVGKVRWTPNSDATAASIASAYSAGLGEITNGLLPNGQPLFTGSFAGFTPGMFPVTGNNYSELSGSLAQNPASLTFKLFADGQLVHTETPSDSVMFRIDDSYGRVDEFQFEIICQQGDVYEVVIAEMPSDLAQA